MTKLDTIRQKIEADRKQEAQRMADLDSISKQIDALDEKINDAIDAGKNDVAEKLITEQNQLKTKQDILRRVSVRKTAPDAYYNELMEINAEEVARIQPKADKASAELKKAYKEYLEKILVLVKILNEAASTRFECGCLAGIGYLDNNARFDAFASVIYNQPDLFIRDLDREELVKMEPQFFEMLSTIWNYGKYE